MKTIKINDLVRDNIKKLVPYSSARNEYSGSDAIFLDANENPNNEPFNRYPDPLQIKVKKMVGEIKNISPEKIFLGNGSDEAIDLLIRIFCQPTADAILSVDPTYGMYKVCADINEVRYESVPLKKNFQPDTDLMLKSFDKNTKLLFLCSPNNPTSNSFNEEAMRYLTEKFNGLVILDEAYIDFSASKSLLPLLDEYQNLVILQTFSKAWGLAGIRLGMCFADEGVISVMNRVKYPYNINRLTLAIVQEALLLKKDEKNNWVKEILAERERVARILADSGQVIKVYPSDANFLLVKVKDPVLLYRHLVGKKIIVRDRSKVNLCEGCLRFTIGTRTENDQLLKAIKTFK